MSRDFARLIFINLIWGFTAILGAVIDLPSVELVLYRTAIAGVGLWILIRICKVPNKASGRRKVKLFLTGFLIGAHWILFFLSVKLSNVSICLVALATTALMTSFISPLVYRGDRIRLREVVLGAIVVAVVALIFGYETGYALGFSVGLGSAFFAACFNLINARLVEDHDHRVIAAWEMLGACVFCACCVPISAKWLSQGQGLDLIPNGMEWIWLLILSLVCTVYAYASYVELLRRLSAYTVALYSNLEPIIGIVLGALFFKEHQLLGSPFYGGAALIIAVLVANSWLDRPASKS